MRNTRMRASHALLLLAALVPAAELSAAAVQVGGPQEAVETARMPPEELATLLLAWDPRSPELLSQLSAELQSRGPDSEVGDYLVATVQSMATALDARTHWTDAELDRLLTAMLVNPRLFVADTAFRYQVAALLREQNDLSVSPQLRVALLEGLGAVPGVDFTMTEMLATAWGLALRSSTTIHRSLRPGERLDIGDDEPIESTILVLTSPFVSADEAVRLVDAMEAFAPERQLLVVHDAHLFDALEAARGPRTTMLSSLGRVYTPWPRDSMILGRHPDGSVAVVLRPNRQPGREGDSQLGRLLLMQLPAGLGDSRQPHWHTAVTPFHNGQILLTQDAAWVSIHSLEEMILERLNIDRVPVESFTTPGGIDLYLDAAEAAATELAELFDRDPAFVHELPRTGTIEQRTAAMTRLAGGGGFDLDSLVTLIPGPDSLPGRAFVGSLQEGVETLASLPASDLEALRQEYGVSAGVDAVASMTATSGSTRGRHLDQFLDAVAEYLQASGIPVTRLPLLLAPVAMLEGRSELAHVDFVIGWNNVVLSATPEGHVAEGFASGLPSLDAVVSARFRAAGVEMVYFPPLIGSVIRNGGYRCATNHLRAPAAGRTP